MTKIPPGNLMLFPDELLVEARRGLGDDQSDQSQGRLRRALSTAYYSLFHLLIAEATANWNRPEQRDRLARCFQHKQMRHASGQVKGRAYADESPDVVKRLRAIAKCFVDLQASRQDADYNKERPWRHAEVQRKVNDVAMAFDDVEAIRSEQVFQDYLLSLFVHEPWEED